MQLILYTTEYCQLCEEAEALIYAALGNRDYELKHIDISESDELMDRYGLRIPVLKAGGAAVELDWPFDSVQLIEFVTDLGSDNG